MFKLMQAPQYAFETTMSPNLSEMNHNYRNDQVFEVNKTFHTCIDLINMTHLLTIYFS